MKGTNLGEFEELVETERGIYEFQKNKIKGIAGNEYLSMSITATVHPCLIVQFWK